MAVKQFQVDSNIIQHLISSQAGSLEKAVLECYMNSVDAGASGVAIYIDPRGDTLTIVDDGHGWRSEADIDATFGTFGFEHGDNVRTYGQFGLGRGQLWNWCAVTYRTNGFRLDVDIRARGLDYEVQSAEHVAGCRIEGRFYEPLDPRSRDASIRNLKEWLAYAEIPVALNGETVSQDPADLAWDQITEHGYFSFKSQSTLLIYNQGVYVGRVSAHEFGTGGVVISRAPMTLNMARNDVLRSECKVWPKIRDTVREAAGEKARNKPKKIDDYDRAFQIREWLAGDTSFDAISELSLLVDARGRARKLNAVKGYSRVAIADERGSMAADKLIQQKTALVLAPEVAEWFDVNDAESLRQTIIDRARSECEQLKQGGYRFGYKIADCYQLANRWEATASAAWADVASEIDSRYEIIDKKDLTRKQKACLEATCAINQRVSQQIRVGLGLTEAKPRDLFAGRSESANAWTDGSSLIAADVTMLAKAFTSTEGLHRLVNIILHEHMYDSSSADDTHTHGLAFYEAFHDIVTAWEWQPRKIVDAGMRAYEKALSKQDLKVPRWVATEGRVVDDEEAALGVEGRTPSANETESQARDEAAAASV